MMCAAVICKSELGTETKVESLGLSLWSQRKTNPKSEMTHCPEQTSAPMQHFRKIRSAVLEEMSPK